MAVEIPSTENTPLLDSPDEEEDTHLAKSLNSLETFLRVFGFFQCSFLSFTLSWVSFLLLGVALPISMIYLSYCSSDCERYEIRTFELQILVFQLLVAAISLIAISPKLRKYGVRKFLFLNSSHGYMSKFRDQYLDMIHGFFSLLVKCILPCLLLKTAREVAYAIYVHNDSWFQSIAVAVGLIVSWTYAFVIYLSGCALFNLVCNLLVIHFENFAQLLENNLDVLLCIEEHIRLMQYLSKISHRFRMFFILELLVVTASQCVALVHTTGNHGYINLINGGDFAVSSIVELVGVIICLHAASKTSHRAQAIASIATRWHSLVTCACASTGGNGATLEANNAADLLPISYSESDLESLDHAPIPTNVHTPIPTNVHTTANASSYEKRQALVMYLLTNTGGFTIYGWRIDRALILTIFFLEFSVVLFVLGKTITF